ncbi:hypothetical protein G9A89_023927 [Geosiphon pyriformis]|nr:hypothetical protein G9A89_023927 [Geosiphon pyriformis]
MSTWEQPSAQNPAESASPLMKRTAILQPIGSSNKKKQPTLAPKEHTNMQTSIPLNVTSNTSPINQIMAYQDIAKLEKFSGEKDNAYSWIVDAEKAITTNGWNNDYTIQALLFFLTRTANSCLMEDQDFDKSTPIEEKDVKQISQPFKQTKSNIPPVTITKDTTLATIFSFNINNLNTYRLFSGTTINQDKPIMALYTNAKVGGIDIKLILDSRSAGSIIKKQLMDQLSC